MNNLCPHNQNPLACLTCFQTKSKAPSPAKPQPTNERQGPVVPFQQATTSPHQAALQAKKDEAYNALQAKLAKLPQQPEETEAEPHEHKRKKHRHKHEEIDDSEAPDAQLDPAAVQHLEMMYPRRPSIIDRLPSHPDGRHVTQGRSGRPVITKGKLVGG